MSDKSLNPVPITTGGAYMPSAVYRHDISKPVKEFIADLYIPQRDFSGEQGDVMRESLFLAVDPSYYSTNTIERINNALDNPELVRQMTLDKNFVSPELAGVWGKYLNIPLQTLNDRYGKNGYISLEQSPYKLSMYLLVFPGLLDEVVGKATINQALLGFLPEKGDNTVYQPYIDDNNKRQLPEWLAPSLDLLHPRLKEGEYVTTMPPYSNIVGSASLGMHYDLERLDYYTDVYDYWDIDPVGISLDSRLGGTPLLLYNRFYLGDYGYDWFDYPYLYEPTQTDPNTLGMNLTTGLKPLTVTSDLKSLDGSYPYYYLYHKEGIPLLKVVDGLFVTQPSTMDDLIYFRDPAGTNMVPFEEIMDLKEPFRVWNSDTHKDEWRNKP